MKVNLPVQGAAKTERGYNTHCKSFCFAMIGASAKLTALMNRLENNFRLWGRRKFNLITEIEHVDPNYKIFTDNLTKEERASINKNIKRKIENTPLDYIKGIFQESNIFLSQRQPKNLLRLLSNSSISRNPSLPKGNFKCNYKRCKIYRLYIIEYSEFELANRKVWKVKKYHLSQQKHYILFKM